MKKLALLSLLLASPAAAFECSAKNPFIGATAVAAGSNATTTFKFESCERRLADDPSLVPVETVVLLSDAGYMMLIVTKDGEQTSEVVIRRGKRGSSLGVLDKTLTAKGDAVGLGTTTVTVIPSKSSR